MNIKSFLLGTASVFAVVGGAQAADLTVAEPVDYVKVCDAAGVGYWYIPGTDTCLKIGGWVREDVSFFDTTQVAEHGPGMFPDPFNHHAGDFSFTTATYLTVTAKSMTDYGWLTGYIAWEGDYNGNNEELTSGHGDNILYVDEAFMSLGPLLAGKTASTYDYGGGFTYDGSDLDADSSHSQVRLSWAASGFGVMLGVEDPRYWASSETDSMPDVVGAVTFSQGPWDAKVSFGVADLTTGTGWGVQGAATVKLDQMGAGDQFRVKAAYASDAYNFVSQGSNQGVGDYWSVLATFQAFFTPQVYAAATFDYLNGPGFDVWQATGQLAYTPVHNFEVGVEVGDTNTAGTDSLWGKLRLQRSFGG
jgi:hypothetical protein